MDNKYKAVEFFKDWSNYLLVTTVAALGWVASNKDLKFSCSGIKVCCIWSLGLSAVFGIFTLALIPLVTEQLETDDTSFYDVKIKFRLFYVSFKRMRIKYMCLPQHVLFIIGVLLFVTGITVD